MLTLLINSLSSGGAETLIVDIINSLDTKIEYEIVCLTSKNNVLENKIVNKSIKPIYLSKGSVYNPWLIFKLIPIIKRSEIIHINLFPSSYFAVLATCLIKKSKRPILLFTEHSTSNRRRGKWVFKGIERFIYKRFDKIIAISEGVKVNLLKWLPFLNQKVFVIYNGIDLEKFEVKADSNNKDGTDKKKILCVGGFRQVKDHPTLLKAFAKLSQEYELSLVGDGVEKHNIEKLADNLGIRKRVSFLGFLNNVHEVYRNYDLLVVPSKWEGFGLVAAEAMACGIPVLVSDVEGLTEITGNAGFQFKSGNNEHLAYMIEFIFQNPKKAYANVQVGLERVKIFSIKNTASNYTNLYVNEINRTKKNNQNNNGPRLTFDIT
jgi:glycosyltransferase involved in cell wall biosynthesis